MPVANGLMKSIGGGKEISPVKKEMEEKLRISQ
jgi:hypothetical protein